MRRLPRPLRSQLDERLFLLKCLVLVAVVRLGLTFFGYQRIRHWLPQTPERILPEGRVRRAAWGVSTAAKWVPRASCLTQAFAAQYLLARSGHRSQIRIGVAKEDGALKAHAWLLSGDAIVLGGGEGDLERYTPLTDLLLRPR